MPRFLRSAALSIAFGVTAASAAPAPRPPAVPILVIPSGSTSTAATIAEAMPDGPPIPLGTINPSLGTFVPRGALPLTGGTIQNPSPTTTDVSDVAIIRDERGLAGGTVGFVNTPVRSTCYSGVNVTSFLWCGIDILQNYAKAGENVARYAQAYAYSGVGPTFAFVNEVIDVDPAGSPQQARIAQEADVRGDGPDPLNNRIALNIFGTRLLSGTQTTNPDATFGYGVKLNNYDTAHEQFNFGYSLGSSKVNWGFDCHQATVLSGCIYMAEGQTIEMFSNVEHGLGYQNGNFIFRRNGVPTFKIGDAGIVENDSVDAAEATFRALNTTSGNDVRITALPTGAVVGTYNNTDLNIFANTSAVGVFRAGGGVVLGGNGASVVKGQVALVEGTSTPTPPGAGYASLSVLPGTNAGTCRLVMFGGTGQTAVTIVDNVGSGC